MDRKWSADLRASQRHVRYSCGSCGYALSSNRLVSSSRHVQVSKNTLLAFLVVDHSRLHFDSDKRSCSPRFWSFCIRRSKIRCIRCKSCIGHVSKPSSGLNSASNAATKCYLNISSLQPL